MDPQKTIKTLLNLIGYTIAVLLLYKPDIEEPATRSYSKPIPKNISSAPLLIVEKAKSKKTGDLLSEPDETPSESAVKTKNVLPQKKSKTAKPE